jgi:hypothetical protein
MSLTGCARKLGMFCLLGAGVLLGAEEGSAGSLQVYSCCCHQWCPPCYIHCAEGAPKIKFKCGCPKPVCDPCSLEHYGYYRTCWQPWPFAPDWSHCPVPPPGALAAAQFPDVLPPGARVMPDKVTPLPPPSKLEGPAPNRSLYREDPQ